MPRNNSASMPDEPVDWFAEFDSETGHDDNRGDQNSPEPKPALSMFPADIVQRPKREQGPLLRVVEPGPPTGPQERYGEYLGEPASFSDRLMADWDRRILQLPEYRTATLALLRRRHKVIAAMAGVLVISTAAFAGSLVMRRWQRTPEKVADQRLDAASTSPSAGGGLFGASLAEAPAQPSIHEEPSPLRSTAPVSTNVVAPKPSPIAAATLSQSVRTAVPTPQPRRTDAPATSSVNPLRTSPAPTSLPANAVSARPPASAAANPMSLTDAPTPSPTPAFTPTRTSAPSVTPTPTPTPAATPKPTPTSTPAAPPRATPSARDDARAAASPATPPVSPELAERSAVEGVLARYRQTFDSLSVDDVAAFWPSVNIRQLSRAFDQLASQNVTFSGCTIDVRGIQADATCRGNIRYVPKVGSHSPRVDSHQWTFLLQRGGSGWTIARVDVR